MTNADSELEELVKKISATELKAEAKKLNIKTGCVKKIDIAKQMPRETLERLAST
jgi:hypothetical protein